MQQIAVVTGASYGLGDAISRTLLDLGYKVYGISRSEPSINNSNFIWIESDLLDDDQRKKFGDQIIEEKIDLLVNNAGVCFLQRTLEYSDADFEKMFELNFKVPVKVTQLLFRKLSDGLILNISSLADRYPSPTWALYGSSKAALNLFFETMAEEQPQVKIINILPSYVDTPMQHQIHDGTEFDWTQCMKPEDVALGVKSVLHRIDEIESGTRIAIEKSVEDDEQYLPEHLWSYSVESGKLQKLR